MTAPYQTAAIANWFLDRAERADAQLDPMKLQKLIYFAHGWYLALAGKALIDEHPQAWEYGPVIPSIYQEFKSFGRGPIKDRATVISWGPRASGQKLQDWMSAHFVTPRIDADDSEVEELLEQVWIVYGTRSAVQLSNMSHIEGGAWEKAFQSADGKRNVEIDDDLIAEEFKAKKNRGEKK
jgi:uncharacterized phage-associated protein